MLELVHSDVCDSNDALTCDGKRYFITLSQKWFDKFKVYKTRVENQLERKIKILRSDRGG